jgi:dipeptidyl aminopeptidase/acylaminoacyl peptidase
MASDMSRRVTFTPHRYLRKIWQLGNFDVSPDGRWTAYEANKGAQWATYLRDRRTGRERLLLQSDEAVLNPEFGPDGTEIAVQSDFEGDENYNLYAVPTDRGPVRKLTDGSTDSSFPRWSPDGTKIAFLSNRNRDRDNVFLVDVATRDVRQLTHEEDIVGEIAWHPDGRRIAYTVGIGRDDRIRIVDLRGRAETLVTFPDSESHLAGDVGRPEPFSPEGRELVFESNRHDHLDLGVIDLDTRAVRWLVESSHDKTMPLWSPDGRRIAFLENREGKVRLMSIGRDGRGALGVSPPDGVAARPRWLPDSSGLLFLHSTPLRPDRLLEGQDRRSRIVVESLRTSLPRAELARPSLVKIESFDGRRIPAWLYVPTKGRSRRAALVKPHGGPESQSVHEWDERSQFLVAQGFTVLLPNYRGGTGYGRAWRKLSDHDLGGGDMKDVLACGRWLIRNRYCPPDRLGIIGISYGGYAVAHALEQAPDLWAVGVSIVGFFNWFTATTTERGYLQRYDRTKMGSPEDDADLFRRLSPFFYLDKIRAPVLFTGGAHDPRCPVAEARQIVEAMHKMGKTVDYLEFPDEGHWPRKISNQVRLYDRAIEWLTRFLPDP